MSLIGPAAHFAIGRFAIVQAATGTPDPNFNENSVTPGWVGFAITFLVAAVWKISWNPKTPGNGLGRLNP
jgi:hypothetical protein